MLSKPWAKFPSKSLAGLAQLVECPVLSHAVIQRHARSWVLDLQCLYVSMWMKMAQLKCWLSRESTQALKPRADVIRSPKQGYQCPHKKD